MNWRAEENLVVNNKGIQSTPIVTAIPETTKKSQHVKFPHPEFDRIVMLRKKTCSIRQKGKYEQERQRKIHGKIQTPTQNQ